MNHGTGDVPPKRPNSGNTGDTASNSTNSNTVSYEYEEHDKLSDGGVDPPLLLESVVTNDREVALLRLQIEKQKLELEAQRLKVQEVQLYAANLGTIAFQGSPRASGASPSSFSENGDETEMFARKLKAVVPKMPISEGAIPNWFSMLEAMFEVMKIPYKLRGPLLLPYLNEKGRAVIARLKAEQLGDYEMVKNKVLDEHRLGPAEYRRRFIHAHKEKGESWRQLAARLQDLFSYYLKSKKITTLDEAIRLLVADQFKNLLSKDARQYCVLQEGNDWLDADTLANLVEQFEDAGQPPRKVEWTAGPSRNWAERHERPASQGSPRRWAGAASGEARDNPKRPPVGKIERGTEGCFNCGERGHLRYQCKKNFAERRVQHVQHVQEAKQESRPTEPTSSGSSEAIPKLVARVAQLEGVRSKGQAWAETGKGAAANELQVVELTCDNTVIKAIVDSGAQISVFRESCIPKVYLMSYGKITLAGPFGERVTAKLACIPMQIQEQNQSSSTEIVCAVSERLTEGIDGLLTPDDMKAILQGDDEKQTTGAGSLIVNSIMAQSVERLETESIIEDKDFCDDSELYSKLFEDFEGEVECKGAEKGAIFTLNVNNIGEDQSAEFKRLQKSDESLKDAWKQAELNQGGMISRDGALYHSDNVHGRAIRQLVAPKSKRVEILKLAHDAASGGHLGYKKTLQRVRASFYWPKMNADILAYCQSCLTCQKRSRVLAKDKVPISPLTRPETAFQTVFMDIMGPIDPPSSRGHRYILTLIDLCTRWPEAVCLRNISARNTCDSLIRIFMSAGIPEQVCCDQGGNFVSDLTKEFTARLGVTMRFSTPYHPEGHGVVERLNGTMRNMLAQVVEEHGRDWDRYVPYLLWALREVPSRTLGVSPFEMMYGRVPQGPLAILKNTWTGHVTLPVNLNKPAQKYLTDLKKKLRDAQQRAAACAEVEQERYVSTYNLRTRPKSFQVGDQVLVQVINPVNKLHKRWDGPAVIKRVERPHRYRICMQDGKERWVHANHLREYRARVNIVGFAYDEDEEFGKLGYAPAGPRNAELAHRPEKLITSPHLDERQVREVRDTITRHPQVFGTRPGRTNSISHKITLREGFQPKRVHAYSVPFALRKEVDRQISELLEMGLIEESNSEFGHPVVCVAKKDGTIRLCGDYRSLNAGTVSDSYPMAKTTELILQVAAAKYISVIDLSRGYWQVPLEPDCRHMTTFVTHKGAYAWTVMAFGLKNAAATFQRLMDNILAEHTEYAMAYLDDIAIFSKDWRCHLNHLDAVIRTLSDHGLTVRADKCRFGCDHIVYLGHVVGSGLHSPDPERTKAVADMLRPKTKKELRSFLGFANYYREYIPGFAEIARPLTDLTGRRISKDIPWGEEANSAFLTLKKRLCDAPSLYAPIHGNGFVLHTDASETAVGACLSQKDGKGGERPIAFASKKLNAVQTRWSTIEREAYAVIWALDKYDTWIFGREVEVVTDHNPLVFLTQASPRGAKLTRWALALQRYQINIKHRKGATHVNADALSRLSVADDSRTGQTGHFSVD